MQSTVLISVEHLATALLFDSTKYRCCAGYVNPCRLCEPVYEWHVSDGWMPCDTIDPKFTLPHIIEDTRQLSYFTQGDSEK